MSIRKDNTKVYGVRLDEKLINDFISSCHSLPIVYKPSSLIESYMKYIISLADEYKNTGKCKMGFLKKDGAIVLFDSVGQQSEFNFDSRDIIDDRGKNI